MGPQKCSCALAGSQTALASSRDPSWGSDIPLTWSGCPVGVEMESYHQEDSTRKTTKVTRLAPSSANASPDQTMKSAKLLVRNIDEPNRSIAPSS